MDIAALVADQTIPWSREAPADPAAVERLASDALFKLPDAYLEFLRLCNGGEGQLGVQPGWFQLWPAEEVEHWNEEYEVQEYIPGFYGFGSSGGGELLAFRREGAQIIIVMVPFIGMEAEYARRVAGSFEEFLSLMGREWHTE